MIFSSLQCPIRFASGLFAYVLLATLGSPAAHAETTTRLDAIVGRGTLRVGLTEDYRPFSFVDPSGKIEIDVDMAMSLAQSLGVKLDIVKTSWSTLKSDLEANSFDIAMGGITITLDRQKMGLFSNPVFFERQRRRSRIAATNRNTVRSRRSINPACA
jgi:cyclohexadienyl dehydratase